MIESRVVERTNLQLRGRYLVDATTNVRFVEEQSQGGVYISLGQKARRLEDDLGS